MGTADIDGRDTGAPGWSIGELSARTGASPRSLRYYEAQGLLTARRTAAGHRRFDDAAIDQVALIQQLFGAGLSSQDIAPVLPSLLGSEEGGAGLDSLVRHRDRLLRESARLQDTAEILAEVIEGLEAS